MKRRILTVLGVVLLISAFTMTAFAATNNTKIDDRITNLQERQQKIDEKNTTIETKRQEFKTKQDEYNQFRAALVQKKDACLINREKKLTLAAENTQLRLDIASSIKAIQSNGTKLDESVTTQLKDLNSQIKAIAGGIKETRGDIKDILTQNKESFKAKDYTALDSAFENIYTIQQGRYDKLEQINGLLKQILSLLSI